MGDMSFNGFPYPAHSMLEDGRLIHPLAMFALVADDTDVSVIAKAFDVSCERVKEEVTRVVRWFAAQLGISLSATKRHHHTMAGYIVAQCTERDISWEALVPAHDVAVIIEARAYFRAFTNRVS